MAQRQDPDEFRQARYGQGNYAQQARQRKVRATFHIPEDLLNEARNTVVALSGPPHRMTLAKLAETALRHELDRLRDEREGSHRGNEFPQREHDLRGGRPISVGTN